MNELLQLLGLVADEKKTEAQKLVDLIKTHITELDAKITDQEKLKLDAIKTRDEMKSKLKDIALKLGASEVENINDAIEAIKTKSGAKGNEELEIKEKEIEQLKAEIQALNGTVEQSKQEAQQTVANLLLERDLALVLPKYKAVEELSKYLIEDIKKQAVYENNQLVFKNEDGTTMRIDGKDATLEAIISKKRDEEVAKGKGIFFDITPQQSGVGNQGGNRIEEDDFLSR